MPFLLRLLEHMLVLQLKINDRRLLTKDHLFPHMQATVSVPLQSLEHMLVSRPSITVRVEMPDAAAVVRAQAAALDASLALLAPGPAFLQQLCFEAHDAVAEAGSTHAPGGAPVPEKLEAKTPLKVWGGCWARGASEEGRCYPRYGVVAVVVRRDGMCGDGSAPEGCSRGES